ncbi:hypothetical protein AB2M95_02540 [Pseudomonas chlororaphis]|uniref:hypothetical protein n=1 Tax=Pseudomonas chlororaphis TaxID=587753 RepID=UPI0034637E21
MKPPKRYKVNGYFVMEVGDGWEVGSDDERLEGPFDTEQEAVSVAESLPPKG